jgi:RNA polymerase sigma factor (sigma-70 family)
MANAASSATLRQIDRLFGAGTVAGLSDPQLLERFAAGRDEAAFAALVERHGPMVLRVCRGVLQDEHAAEDAFQATFLVLVRKAPSLGRCRALGGWLYRVAYRIAIAASAAALRRRQHERKAIALATTTTADSHPLADWLPVMHEEIDRLPERHRAAIVLCCLQGMTYEQAAHELRWTVPTLRCRLARARERLRARLTRRGLTGAGASLAALFRPQPSSATVPAAWAREAVAAAMQRTTMSVSVAALAAHGLRAMGWSQLREAATLVLTLGALVSLSIIAMIRGRGEPEQPPQNPPAAPSRPVLTSKANDPSDETVAVHGRVVDPAGKPVGGATVQLDEYLYRTVPPPGGGPSAVSSADGQYTLVAPRDLLERFPRGETRVPFHLIASAPGYGPGWADVADSSGVFRDVTVRLAADDIPIEGRILDLEGRPIAGAQIVTSDLYDPPGGDLTPWVEGMKVNPTSPYEGGNQQMPFKMRRTTGPDGRFRLDGVGRERIVMFTVGGPTIALTRTFAMTKNVPPIRSSNTYIIGPKTMIFHGARFDFAVAPCKPIVGSVRDLDTGKPLIGVKVNGAAYGERDRTTYHELAVTTDDQGRYRLTGMAKAEKYRLFLWPGEGQPYCNASFVEPATTPGLEPATIDLRLKRGVLIRGRITDKETGRPVKGGSVNSFAMRDNPHVDEYPGFKDAYVTTAYPDEDGRFAIAALPGRGMLGVYASSERYLRGVGAEAIRKPGPGPEASLRAYPGFPFASSYHRIVAFDASSGSEAVSLDLQLDPGRVVLATAVDPDGKPVPGCRAFGTRSLTYWDRRPLDSATFQVTALDPRQTRRVMVYHEGRRLGGTALIGKDEAGPLTIQLQPCGIVTGRLVDEEGQPRTKVELVNYGFRDDGRNYGVFHRHCPVDREGRFRIELIPGLPYTADAETEEHRTAGQVFLKLVLGPGEVRDLGDVVVKAPPRP